MAGEDAMRRFALAFGYLSALLLSLAALVGSGFDPHFLCFVVLGILAGAHGMPARAVAPADAAGVG